MMAFGRSAADLRLDEVDGTWDPASRESCPASPGDLLFFANTGKLSDFIRSLDGWWTHVALVVDADETELDVVHSVANGVRRDRWTWDEARELKGPKGIALARLPRLDEPARARAIEWARGLATDGETDYSVDDLALASALAMRYVSRRSGARRGPTRGQLDRASEALPSREDDGSESSVEQCMSLDFTCAGFVYAAFQRAAGYRIAARFPEEIIRVSDTHVLGPEEVDMTAMSLALDDPDDLSHRFEEDEQTLGLPGPFKIRQLASAFLKAVPAALNNQPLPIVRVVSPGALWLADDVTRLTYVFQDSRDAALEGSADAGPERER